jgi:uncharacterized protein
LTLPQFLAATVVVALGAVLQGTIGFGLGLFGAPLLLLIDPLLVPGPLLGASAVLTLLLTRREWGGVRGGDLGWALGGRLAGTLAALAVLTALPAERLDLLLGGLVLLGVALTASGLHLRPTPRMLLGAGALSGFMGTTTTIGGPPIALVYSRESGPRLRGTLSAFFVVGVMVSVIGLALVGRFGLRELRLAGLLLPGVVVGFVASRHTSTALDRGFLRPAVLGVSAISALVVILRAVV